MLLALRVHGRRTMHVVVQLDAALEVLQNRGAVVMCGEVSGAEPPKNLRTFIHWLGGVLGV